MTQLLYSIEKVNTRIRTALKSLQLFKKLAQLTPRKTVSPISTSLGGPKIKELALHPHLGYILTQKIHHPHTPRKTLTIWIKKENKIHLYEITQDLL